MHPKVEEYIYAKQEEINERKNDYLVSLGLYEKKYLKIPHKMKFQI